MVGPAPQRWRVDPDLVRVREAYPGLWQMRLPAAWSFIPNANAYLIAGSSGAVLIDTGVGGDPTNLAALQRALELTGHRIEDVVLMVATHAHSDHIGLAGEVCRRSGAPLWMHHDVGHIFDARRDPSDVFTRRSRRALAEGVPAEFVARFADVTEELEAIADTPQTAVALAEGVTVPTALGAFTVIETPGHAPSHVSLVNHERGLLLLGDLMSTAFFPYFDYGCSADPVGEFLTSVDRVGALAGIELALPGHGGPITDLPAVTTAHREGIADRLRAAAAVVQQGPAGAWELTRRMFEVAPADDFAASRLTQMMGYLAHLRRQGQVAREVDGGGRLTYHLAGQ